jgi:hypothetical protein
MGDGALELLEPLHGENRYCSVQVGKCRQGKFRDRDGVNPGRMDGIKMGILKEFE